MNKTSKLLNKKLLEYINIYLASESSGDELEVRFGTKFWNVCGIHHVTSNDLVCRRRDIKRQDGFTVRTRSLTPGSFGIIYRQAFDKTANIGLAEPRQTVMRRDSEPSWRSPSRPIGTIGLSLFSADI